jgi:hypothetical protein
MSSTMTGFGPGSVDTLRLGHTAVRVAPDQPLPSQDDAAFRQQDAAMVGTLQEIRVDAVERNADFSAALERVRASAEAASRLLHGSIVPSRKAADAEQRTAAEASLAALEAELTTAINSTFDRHVASLVAPDARMDAARARELAFMGPEIEAVTAVQTGKAVQEMEEDREDFELDVVAGRAMEANLAAQIGAHVRGYTNRRDAEAEDRARQAAYLTKQFEDSFAALQDSAGRLGADLPARLQVVAEGVGRETAARVEGDEIIATRAAEAMSRLRADALAFFGAQAEEGGS